VVVISSSTIAALLRRHPGASVRPGRVKGMAALRNGHAPAMERPAC
jgi:hypothetical protein